MKQRAVLLLIIWSIPLLVCGSASSGSMAAEESIYDATPTEVLSDPLVVSLADCVQAALENNFDIAVARYDPLQTETLLTVEKAVFDPSLTGRATSSDTEVRRIFTAFGGGLSSFDEKKHDYGIGFIDPLILGGNYEIGISIIDSAGSNNGTPFASFDTSWQLTFRQPLLRNLGPEVNRSQIVVARNTLGISESLFRQTVLDTVSEAEKAYWNLNFTLMDFETKQASLQQAKDFLEQNRIKVRVGTLAPIEITQAEADVAERDQDLIISELAIEQAEDALRRIMGTPAVSSTWRRPIRPSQAPPLEEMTPDWEETVDAAIANRPDLEQARLDLQSKEVDLAARKNLKRWGLEFQGSYGVQGFNDISYRDSFEDLTDRNQPNWSLQLTLDVPIGNRQAVANFTNAKYALSQAAYEKQRVGQLALLEVRNAVRRVITDLKRVKAAEVSTRLQREKLDAEQKKFENGMSTSFEVLTFQTDLAQAETRQNLAIVDYNKSLVELERVKGTLLQARGIVVPMKEPGSGAGVELARAAALRKLWKPSLGNRDEGLRLADTSDDAIVLPTVFAFDSRLSAP